MRREKSKSVTLDMQKGEITTNTIMEIQEII
jgi:hypothetical protein